MSKTAELKNTTSLVKAILEENELARNSDRFLYYLLANRLAKEIHLNLNYISYNAVMLNMSEWGFPPFESVRRARQKLQAEFPELSANKKVAAHRAENEQAFRQFAREGAC